jgi:1-acyl-sn-glycerol-3-phosphate acyltransferase
VRQLLRWLSVALLKLTGWRTEGTFPEGGGFVVVVAPHSSYWDGLVAPAAAAKLRLAPHWFGTHTLFRGPLRPIMRWFGGVPVDRSRRTSLVAAAVAAFAARPDMVLALAPEGTRFRVDHWKSGFYRIATGAGVPVVPGYLDHRRKVAGIGAPLMLTGSVEEDLAKLRAVYRNVEGRIRHRFDSDGVRLRPE